MKTLFAYGRINKAPRRLILSRTTLTGLPKGGRDALWLSGVGEALGDKVIELLKPASSIFMNSSRKSSGCYFGDCHIPGVGPKTAQLYLALKPKDIRS